MPLTFTGFPENIVGSNTASIAALTAADRNNGCPARAVAATTLPFSLTNISTVTVPEALSLFPLMDWKGIEGALYIPSDGSATAPILARALINKAQAAGVTFCPNTKVTSLNVVNGQIKSVDTINGAIETETLVMATGIWSPLVEHARRKKWLCSRSDGTRQPIASRWEGNHPSFTQFTPRFAFP